MKNIPVHTHLIVATAIDNKGQPRHLSLQYNQAESWHSTTGTSNDDELYRGIMNLMKADSNIVAFQGEVYRIERGVYKKITSFWPQMAD